MGSPNIVPIPKPNDGKGIVNAIRKLASLRLNADSNPTFASLEITGSLTTGSLTMNGQIDMQDNPITDVGYIDFNLVNGVSPAEGRLVWNDVDKTLNLGMAGNDVNQQIGLEQMARGKNVTGTATTNGRPARFSGASGSNPEFGFSDADNPAAAGSIGLFTEDINTNSNGYVTTYGRVRDIDTIGGGESWAAGDRIYVSNTAGELTNISPTGSERIIFIGIVLRVHANEGVLWINPINVSYLSELSGVTITSVADQDVLQYNSSAGIWVNTNRLNEIWDYANGTFLESIDFLVTENAGTVTGSLELTGGGELTQRFSDGYFNLDTDPALTVDLTAYVGTDSVPKTVYVYILQSNKGTIVASNSGWPATEHIKIADLVLRSATATGIDGSLVNRNHNDHTQGTNGQGHFTHIEERLRKEACHWESGVALTLKDSAGNALTTGNSSTAVELVTSVGSVYQLHDQVFPAVDMYVNASDDIHITNQPVGDGGAYFRSIDLVTDIQSEQDGTALGTNKYFNLVIWGIQNKTGEASHLMVNLPSGQYTVESQAITDADGYSIFDIPSAFKGTGFLIARMTFRITGGGSTWTYIAQEDLRGKSPSISAGVGVSTTDHSLLTNLTADDHTQYHTDARADTWGSTWAGSSSLITLGTVTTGTWSATMIAVNKGGTGEVTAQAAINSLTAVSGATNEHVLTKDTGTGNAIWKAASGSSPGGSDSYVQYNNSSAFGGDAEFTFNDTTKSLTLGGSFYLKEMAVAKADGASYGQLWVKDDAPNTLWFTNDVGDDTQLGTSFITAGDPATYDFVKSDLTLNNAFHDMDLSGIAPAGAKAVIMSVRMRTATVGSYFAIKPGSNTNNFNISYAATQVANQFFYSPLTIEMDASMVLKYAAANVTWTNVDISILGWLK